MSTSYDPYPYPERWDEATRERYIEDYRQGKDTPVPEHEADSCTYCDALRVLIREADARDIVEEQVQAFADANVIGVMPVSEHTAAMVLQAAQAIDPSFVAAECITDADGANAIMLTRRDFSGAVRIAEES